MGAKKRDFQFHAQIVNTPALLNKLLTIALRSSEELPQVRRNAAIILSLLLFTARPRLEPLLSAEGRLDPSHAGSAIPTPSPLQITRIHALCEAVFVAPPDGAVGYQIAAGNLMLRLTHQFPIESFAQVQRLSNLFSDQDTLRQRLVENARKYFQAQKYLVPCNDLNCTEHVARYWRRLRDLSLIDANVTMAHFVKVKDDLDLSIFDF